MTSLVLLQRDHEASPRLQAVIESAKGLVVQARLHTVEEARAHIFKNRPDILVTDLRVQDGEVAELLAELHQTGGRGRPHVLVTMVAHDDAALLAALRAGADGYWAHTRSPELLVSTLLQLARGESPMSPLIARQVLAHFSTRAGEPKADAMTEALNPLVLTEEERQIVERLAQGYLVDEIAQQWQASAHSIASGIRRVYRKLQFELRASALSLVV
jgi:DNA-binding NarL/FixJ family response regulator